MKKSCIFNLTGWLMTACLMLPLSGCSDKLSGGADGAESVLFTTSLPGALTTRSAMSDWQEQMDAYKAVSEAYEFTVGMYGSGTLVAEGVYQPKAGDTDGTLVCKTGTTPLYWPNTTTAYGFKAIAGSDVLSEDQTTQKKWLLQDRLEGYGYVSRWEGDENTGSPVDDLDALNYRTAKQWRQQNIAAGLVSNEEDYRKIPLYVQHKRSLITVILKAGEGVSREAIGFDVAHLDLSTKICSYTVDAGSNKEVKEITPLASEAFVDYDADRNGPAQSHVSTTRYDAIVDPYDYSASALEDVIAKITLSGQHYSFYASSDFRFDDPVESNNASYNLEPGKHLTITVTLSRDSRKILMTAYIEDWTEDVTTTICDDYGNAGEPIRIKTRQELIDFLSSDSKNKAGNVALVTNDIDLEDWDSGYDLYCTLNLGGCTLLSDYRFINRMEDVASLLNGTIQIGGSVDAAVAARNYGIIEGVRVTARENSPALATVAGAVIENHGTVTGCSSSLKVSGSSAEYVGGIAAVSLSSDNHSAVIDGCSVTNRVSGGSCGGGIVGQANGYVTNNTFEYGITLLQDKSTHKNIVGEKNIAHELHAENNAWPTVDDDYDLINATDTENRYSGIIDSEEELTASTGSTYNIESRRYRLACDMTVSATAGDVAYELDGNERQISTGSMLFNAVTGRIHDLTVYVNDNLIATPLPAATDGIAPLAFEVGGEQAELRNIRVKMAQGTYIQAANPAGVVVWAWGGATIAGCEVKADIRAYMEEDLTQGRKFAGGIVSTVSKATVTQCIFHSISSTLTGIPSTIIYYGGIVGGIEKKNETSDVPELTVTDCTCFETLPNDAYHGGILGNSLLKTGFSATKDCQGNWWPSDCSGVGKYTGDIESNIGKRNGVTPSEKQF